MNEMDENRMTNSLYRIATLYTYMLSPSITLLGPWTIFPGFYWEIIEACPMDLPSGFRPDIMESQDKCSVSKAAWIESKREKALRQKNKSNPIISLIL